MVHHELHQPQSDASWTLEDERRHVSSVFLAECQVYPGLQAFHLCEKKTKVINCCYNSFRFPGISRSQCSITPLCTKGFYQM